MSGWPRPAAPAPQARLPDGFCVVLDPRTRRLGPTALLGGAPLRLLRLAPKARRLLAGTERLSVTDPTTAALARRLLDAGVAQPRPSGSARSEDVTVVVPVRDRPDGLATLLAAVRATAGGLPVIVVDDGSRDAAAVGAVCARYGARLIRHERPGGPARARNTGLTAARTPFVALLDSDCRPQPGWLMRLSRHLDDPLVAAVAPRIVAVPRQGDGRVQTWIAGYERVASALDLGPREGPVHPRGAVPYVPSAALLVRRSAVSGIAGGGYDEAMHVAEDVDLVWRLVEAGWRVRYEPAATVAHDHRTDPLAWARRRAFYGTGAAALAARHADSVAPLILSPVSGLAWGLLLLPRPWGSIAAGGVLAWSSRRLSGQLTGLPQPRATADRLVVLGTAYAGRQLCSAAVRHYWPLSLALAVVSPRARRLLAVAAVADGVGGWWPRRHRTPFLGYLLARRIDDASYGAGLWWGAWRHRDVAALRPASGRRHGAATAS